MDKLWAPWRKAYLTQKPSKKCIFCALKRSKKDAANFVLGRSQHSFACLNIYPYNAGHVLVAPVRHVACLTELQGGELADLHRLVNKMIIQIRKTLKPSGINLGVNLGRAAGAGIPGHVHVHLVPRWNGDTNFMPVIGQTKVISESLKSAYQRLSVRS